MQQLNSSNYDTVLVITRHDGISIPADKGTALMQYLTTDGAGSHIMITDTQGVQTVISKHEIKRIQPLMKLENKTIGMTLPTTELSEEQRQNNLSKIQEMREKFNARKK